MIPSEKSAQKNRILVGFSGGRINVEGELYLVTKSIQGECELRDVIHSQLRYDGAINSERHKDFNPKVSLVQSTRLLKEIYSVGVIIWAILAIVAALAIFYTRETIIHMLDLPQTPLRPGQNVSDYTNAILGSCFFGFLSFVLWLLFVALLFIFYRSGIKDMMYS